MIDITALFVVRYIHAKDRLERRLCSQAKRALAIISTSVLKTDDLGWVH